jgi:hypothetical protein
LPYERQSHRLNACPRYSVVLFEHPLLTIWLVGNSASFV